MSSDSQGLTDRDRLLDRLAAEYLEAVESGRHSDRGEWLRRYPDVAEELAGFFADQDRLERLATPLRQVARAACGPDNPGPDATLGFGESAAAPVGLGGFGDYELLEELGRGGGGVIYRACQASLGRVVALKLILSGRHASEAERQRFQSEAEAVANLDHPHIVPVHEVGAHDGIPFFTMKFLPSGSLSDGIARGDWPAIDRDRQRRAAGLVADVARAVHHAHQRGVLSPSTPS